ncbi:hypothetical protein [Rhodococcus erythropolis]|uniref:Alpha/beta hydrolase n=1 Tax=Rhodococcus erythropolis TaxID=1833 RepID=A0AAX3ZY18_RHOER|nr:hypothetical protein [Rhodococcus erythropolis]WMN01746.1 hypothetical protein QIE55_31060 [Rhodococcus erythropolis]
MFNRHLQLWQDWNRDNSGPFGDLFTGQIDLSSIGMIGHSRGGDAVARYASDDAGVPPLLPISAMVLFAPVLPITGETPDPPPIPTVITEGTCDGDVSNDPSGYVRDKLLEPDGSTVMITVAGANHNFFNTEWSPSTGRPDGIDDGDQAGSPQSPCTPAVPRLSETEQRTLAVKIAARTFNAAAQDLSITSALSTLPAEFPSATVHAYG